MTKPLTPKSAIMVLFDTDRIEKSSDKFPGSEREVVLAIAKRLGFSWISNDEPNWPSLLELLDGLFTCHDIHFGTRYAEAMGIIAPGEPGITISSIIDELKHLRAEEEKEEKVWQ